MFAYIHFRERLKDVIAPLKYRRLFRSKISSRASMTTGSHRKDEKTLIEQSKDTFFSYKQKMSELNEYRRGNESLRGLWASSIKNIEGKYGSGVGTYFRYLRTLLSLNAFISFLR